MTTRRFEGRRALVTGAASGIGRQTAIRLGAEGATVACLDHSLVGLGDTVETITQAGGSARSVVCDLAEREAIGPVVDDTAQRMGGLDVVCNIAGIFRMSLDEAQTLEMWDRIIAVNLTATWLVCQAALPHLLSTGRGAIVNTTSTGATNATPYQTAYAASKGGVISLTRSLAVNHMKAGLRVNCVAPGPIDTPIASTTTVPDGADLSLMAMIMPVGQLGHAEDVASVFAFLASDDAAHVNGQVIRVDGGQRA
jgi:NAD(P)-dependent dehydrogenase (short-subunit alcohol dehydrogenase family)